MVHYGFFIGSSSSYNQAIEELSRFCHFNDCQHESEPNCAVKKAIEEDTLEENRLRNYKKMLRELEYLERRQKEKTE